MSVQNRLKAFYEGLAAVNTSSGCFHYFAPSSATAPYIVWNEDSEDDSFLADNHKERQALSGYVEYFTPNEFDGTFDSIQSFLDGFEGLSWTWEATQYGDPTEADDNLIHHTWSWRMR